MSVKINIYNAMSTALPSAATCSEEKPVVDSVTRRRANKFFRQSHRFGLKEQSGKKQLEKRLEGSPEWKQMLQDAPSCPRNLAAAEKIKKKSEAQELGSAQAKIQWLKLKSAGPILRRYHPGAAYEMRGIIKKYSLKSDGKELAPTKQTWGIQCTYDEEGQLIPSGPGAGTFDRMGPGKLFQGGLRFHMRKDVYTYDAAVYMDSLFGGCYFFNLYVQNRPNPTAK